MTIYTKLFTPPIPSISIPLKFPIGFQTTTNKDSSGNSTGTKTTNIEAEVTTPSSSENPEDSPSLLKVTETTTETNYDINNQVIDSTETVNNGSEKPEQQDTEIEIDDVQAEELEEKEVSFPFETNSWGSGSCPSPRSVDYHYGSLSLTFQPACDFAEGIRPIVLILAGFVAMYIIIGAARDT
nr:MAG: hypothetical protein A4S08_12600 [Proteobacteria bacterium SG_bin4]